MQALLRALGINAIIAIAYTGLIVMVQGQNEGMILSGMMMMGQGALNLIPAIVLLIKGEKAWALGCLLSALILPIVGFSTCVTGFNY